MKLLFVTAPADSAPELVRTLVQEHLIACGNILPAARSFYRWEGELCDDQEAVLLMETAATRLQAVMQRIEDLHPHDCPKIVVIEPSSVNDEYMRWVEEQTRAT